MWGTVLSVGASLLGSAMQGDATDKAVDAQTKGAAEAIGEQRRQFDLNRTDLAPWRSAGGAAVSKLAGKLGLESKGVFDQAGYDDAMRLWNAQDAAGNYWARIGAAPTKESFYSGGVSSSDPDFGSLNRKFTMDDFQNDPVTKASFDFGLSEGEKAVQRMFGARGLGRSGAAVKAASRFATDYTGTKAGESYNRYYGDQDRTFNRLAGVSGTGQTAATNTASMGTNMANNISDITVGTGNARGAAAIAGGNSIASGLASAGNNIRSQFTLDRILGSRDSSVPVVQPSVPGQFNLDAYG